MTDAWMEEPLGSECDRARLDTEEALWLDRELGTLLPLVGTHVPVPPAQWGAVRRRLGLDRGCVWPGRACVVAATSVVSLLLIFSLALPPVHAREVHPTGPSIQLVPVPREHTGSLHRPSPIPERSAEVSGPTFAPLPTPPEPLSE